MAHVTPPRPEELPSPARLRRAAIIAALVAAVVAVVVVLPAERAVDPTGLGSVLGLTEMGMIKQEFKAELASDVASREAKRIADSTAAADKAAVLASLASGAAPARTDTTGFTIRSGDEAGVELQMLTKAWAVFEWSAARGVVDFDVRGDSVGAQDWWYHRYESADSVRTGAGVLIAKFRGTHGFYWKNDADSSVAITIVTRGNYSALDHTNARR